MPTMVSERVNAERSLDVAQILFPEEKWFFLERNIYIAKSRLVEERAEKKKWDRELSQTRILTRRGSVVYLLPEKKQEGMSGLRCADAVIDGEVVELKTVTGTRATLSKDFKKGYKQGASLMADHDEIRRHSVFVRLYSKLPVESVKAKIAGELKTRFDDGSFICYFEESKKLCSWTYQELREMIGKK